MTDSKGQGEWLRSENFRTDLARALEHGDFYDCTFQVTSKLTGEVKNVKCHKFLLSISSCVFAKMLFGHFKEALLGADEAIALHGVSSEVFECSMKFLYGEERNFHDVELAMEVFKFAHKMQITSLMHAVNKFFKTVNTSEALLAVCDFCIQMVNEQGLQICHELVQRKNSTAVLNSDAWLVASESVVQEVLQLDKLDVSELEVVGVLLKWGRAQVHADGHAPSVGTWLRRKVGSCLKCIRFSQLSIAQFTDLCRSELGRVLSGEEKFQILNCITQQKWDMMPDVLLPVILKPRTRLNVSLPLNLTQGPSLVVAKLSKLSSSFSLKMNRKCCFLGLKYILAEHSAPVKAKMQPKSIKVTEKNYPIYVLGQSFCDSSRGNLMLQKECTFLAGVAYTVHFTFPSIPLDCLYKTYVFGFDDDDDDLYYASGDAIKVESVSNGNLTATVFGPLVGVQVKELIFRMLD